MIQEIEDLRKTLECKTCGSMVNVKKRVDIEKLTCTSCNSKNYELLYSEYSEEEIEESKEKFRKCYEDVKEVLNYYMDMPEKLVDITTLWIIGSYLHQSFNTYPFLFVNATKGSGKTRLLRLISHLAYKGNGQVLRGLTESVFFRTPKGHTLTLDEMESIGSKNKSELREYLNASYKRGGVVKRMKKIRDKGDEKYEIETFEPYKPIAMANIWGMEEVLGDRCINLILQKSNNPAKTKIIEDFEESETINSIKRTLEEIQCSLCSVVKVKKYIEGWNNYIKELYNYTTTYTTLLTHTTETTLTTQINDEYIYREINKSEIEGRNLELFFPLLITSYLINKDCFKESLIIFQDMSKTRIEDELSESKDVSLIDFVSRQPQNLNFIQVAEITRNFKAYLGNIDDEDDRWLNSRWVGRALKRLNLVLDKRRVASGNEVTLNVAEAKKKIQMFSQEKND